MGESGTTAKGPNVFLTWSGERSGAVASALHSWLRGVVQQCRPWMSKKDIDAGKRGRAEVRQQLDSISVGVLCLTPENVDKPWVNFEAGALSKQVNDDSRVIPYCFGLKPTDYPDPLGDFQGVVADKEGTRAIVQSINAAMPDPLDSLVLAEVFDRAWPSLEAALKAIPATPASEAPKRRPDEMITEILDRVRQIERGMAVPDPIGLMSNLRFLAAALDQVRGEDLESVWRRGGPILASEWDTMQRAQRARTNAASVDPPGPLDKSDSFGINDALSKKKP